MTSPSSCWEVVLWLNDPPESSRLSHPPVNPKPSRFIGTSTSEISADDFRVFFFIGRTENIRTRPPRRLENGATFIEDGRRHAARFPRQEHHRCASTFRRPQCSPSCSRLP